MAKSGSASIFHFDISRISYRMVLATLAALLFAIYGPRVSTDVPDVVRVFFENSLARFAIIVLIIYIGNQNLELSVFIAVVIILVMSFVHKYDIKESLTNKIHEDFYSPSAAREHCYKSLKTIGKKIKHADNLINKALGEEKEVQQEVPGRQHEVPRIPAGNQHEVQGRQHEGGGVKINYETPTTASDPDVSSGTTPPGSPITKPTEEPFTVEQFQSGFARTMDAVIEHTH